MSPALAGRFLITGPPGKPHVAYFRYPVMATCSSSLWWVADRILACPCCKILTEILPSLTPERFGSRTGKAFAQGNTAYQEEAGLGCSSNAAPQIFDPWSVVDPKYLPFDWFVLVSGSLLFPCGQNMGTLQRASYSTGVDPGMQEMVLSHAHLFSFAFRISSLHSYL